MQVFMLGQPSPPLPLPIPPSSFPEEEVATDRKQLLSLATTLENSGLLKPVAVPLAELEVSSLVCGPNFFFLLSTDGQAFAAGVNSYGQLGVGHKRYCPTLTPVALHEEGTRPLVFTQLSAGSRHAGGISTSGDLYLWGENVYSKCSCSAPAAILSPKLIQIEDEFRQTAVSPQKLKLEKESHSSSEPSTTTTTTTEENSEPVRTTVVWVSVGCGGDHTAAVGRNGKLYTCGSGVQFRLGHNDERDRTRLTPISHEALEKVSVASCACGAAHTCCIDTEGKLYSFGVGADGRLGHGDIGDRWYPRPVPALENVEAVVCGERHTVCVTQTGKSYSWGRPDAGRLGYDAYGRHVSTPREIESLSEKKIKQVKTSSSSALAIDDEGRVYVWGDNSSGQIATSKDIFEIREAARIDCIDPNEWEVVTAAVAEQFSVYACKKRVQTSINL